jgi:hypothetical protein
LPCKTVPLGRHALLMKKEAKCLKRQIMFFTTQNALERSVCPLYVFKGKQQKTKNKKTSKKKIYTREKIFFSRIKFFAACLFFFPF